MSMTIHVCGEPLGFRAEDFAPTTAEPFDAVVYLGEQAGNEHVEDPGRTVVLVELDRTCLGVFTGEASGEEGDNRVGFSRYRVGSDWRGLVELVVQARTASGAVAEARRIFAELGYETAVCADVPGRILDRMLRPYLNDALRGLDEGLASAQDLDTTVRLGLGYPEGPIALLQRTGLADHHAVTEELWRRLGEPGFVSARRARVAAERLAHGDPGGEANPPGANDDDPCPG